MADPLLTTKLKISLTMFKFNLLMRRLKYLGGRWSVTRPSHNIPIKLGNFDAFLVSFCKCLNNFQNKTAFCVSGILNFQRLLILF